jgi:hypothetical protein
MTHVTIPTPTSGGLILSYKCQARCRHCIYACSPDWPADFISEENLERGLAGLAGKIQPSLRGPQRVGLSDGLHFTGGEPFINFKLLRRAVEIAAGYGIPSLFVETNSGWCIDDETAEEKLRQLKAAGLHGIMISVNPFYAEYVPFAFTERCIRISQAVFGVENVMIYQIEYYLLFLKLGIKDTLTLEEYAQMARHERAPARVEMFFMGRATSQLKPLYPSYPARVFFDLPCQPPFLRDWHNHFDNYGHFMPGFCGGISLGDWFELDRLLAEGIDTAERPVLGFLIAGNMRGLFNFARDFGYEEAEAGYLSKCDLCTDLRKFLIHQGDFPEIAPRQFYQHLT